jgi:transposase-like protein
METPDSLQEAVIWFSEFENCRRFMMHLRWPDGKVLCPGCGSDHVFYIEKERVWKCYGKHDHAKFSLKTGTVFEDSPIVLEKWLPAAWLVMNCKNGISSYEVSRALKVTQKTAWFMLQRIRLALQDDLTGGMLGGEVEVDETFIGGKARNMHKNDRRLKNLKGGGSAGKAIVLGILERETEGKSKRVRTTVIPDRTKTVMQENVRPHVEAGSQIYSDDAGTYWRMDDQYTHDIINHAEEYVRGNVHTNGLENFWSLLKRSIGGSYVSVEPFHLFRYVDEQAFRYSYRKLTDAERFVIGMKQIQGKRLRFDELTGKSESRSSDTRRA